VKTRSKHTVEIGTLEVRSSVRSALQIRVAIHVRIVVCQAAAAWGFVLSNGCVAGVDVVVAAWALVSAVDSPQDEADTAEQDSTSDAANYTADDLL
jgi:hypothetical protein